MHSTKKLDDGYVGSGKRLGYSIRKHGRENHTCEILEHYFTREWLCEREAQLVNEELLNDAMCMNLRLGGEGGWDYARKSDKLRDYLDSGRNVANLIRGGQTKTPEQRSAQVKKAWINKREVMLKANRTGLAVMQTHEVNAKRKATFAEIGHSQGEKNSQYGTCWIHSISAKMSMKIPKGELDKYLADGWLVGRKMKFD